MRGGGVEFEIFIHKLHATKTKFHLKRITIFDANHPANLCIILSFFYNIYAPDGNLFWKKEKGNSNGEHRNDDHL
jgi:hypothetical protein